PPPPPPPNLLVQRIVGFGITLLVVLWFGSTLWSRSKHLRAAEEAAAASASAAANKPTGPRRVVDRPDPRTSSPQALAAYRAGMQAFRDCVWYAPMRSFERAATLDPTFAAAHLRAAIFTTGTLPTARAHLHQTITERNALNNH